MENLKKELIQLQKKCIGLFQYDYSSGLYMVIEEFSWNNSISIVSFGILGGLHENTIDFNKKHFGKEYKKFPNGKNLYEFLKENDHTKIKEFLDSFKNSDQNQIQIQDTIDNLEL